MQTTPLEDGMPPDITNPTPWRVVVPAIAVGSGAAALLYQSVWLRWFELLFGSTAYAASATLCAFFAGLAIGSALFGRLVGRLRRPLAAYAAVEVGAALLALGVPWVFRAYEAIYPELYATLSDARGWFITVKFGLALAAMLPCAILLGGTFPLLATAHVRGTSRLGREGVTLYALNTLGGSIGVAAGLLWLPEIAGVRGTYATGVSLSLTLALVAWIISRSTAAGSEASAADRPQIPAARRLLAVAFASGFGTLALEVLLIQALARILDHSIYSLGSVMVVVLAALVLGALIVSWTADLVAPRTLLSGTLAVEALLLLALPALLSDQLGRNPDPAALRRGLEMASRLAGPPLLIGALVFPLCFRLAEGGGIGRRVGGLLAANTLGGIAGSLSASFVGLAALGLWYSIAALGVVYGMVWLAIAQSRPAALVRGAALAAVLVAIALGPLAPGRLPVVSISERERLVDLREGAHGVVAVVDNRGSRNLKLNDHYTLSGLGRLYRRKERLGHVPLLLHPQPRRVLFVGSATGQTAGAAVAHPVEEIVLVELVPEVRELAAEHFAYGNRQVYSDPRTRVVVEDGRNHLRATSERYDVINADLFSAWRPGVGSLYTREHFESVRERLTPRGVFCQWLPLYQHGAQEFETIAATFLDVFPGALVFRGSFSSEQYVTAALVGFRGGPPPEAEVERRVAELAAGGVDDRWVTRNEAFWTLYAGPLASLRDRIAGALRNSDDHPVFEFVAGRSTPAQRLHFLRRGWPEAVETLRSGATPAPLGASAARGAEVGALLYRANREAVAGRRVASEATLARAEALIDPALLTPPDPSMAEMWRRPTR
jgi:spermidine synthase